MFGFGIPRLLTELVEWKVLHKRLDALQLEVDAPSRPSAVTIRRWRTELDAIQADSVHLR